MNDKTNIEDFSDNEEKSKSQIKREFKAYQELGKRLVELPTKQLEDMPLSETMRELILTAQSVKHGTLNRQLRLIGSRMPDENIEAIELAVEKLRWPQRQISDDFHQVEQWRDSLLQGDQTVFEQLTNSYQNFDRQYVNQMVRNAKKEASNNKPSKSSRLLFKYLSELQSSDRL